MSKKHIVDEELDEAFADIQQQRDPNPRPVAKPLTDKEGNVLVTETDLVALQWRISELEEDNRRLRSNNSVLDRENDALLAEIRRYEIRAEIQKHRDEIAELEDEEERLDNRYNEDPL